MNNTLRNILAAIAGLVGGGMLNMALVELGPYVFPLPDGVDVSTPEGLKAAMPLMKPVNFVFPFLAHALGTLVGAWIAVRLSAGRSLMRLAWIVAVFSFIGGVMAVAMFGGPLWFAVTDLALAYFPMAYIGGKLGKGKD